MDSGSQSIVNAAAISHFCTHNREPQGSLLRSSCDWDSRGELCRVTARVLNIVHDPRLQKPLPLCLLSRYHVGLRGTAISCSRPYAAMSPSLWAPPREVLLQAASSHPYQHASTRAGLFEHTSGDATRGEGTAHCYATTASIMICLGAQLAPNICLNGFDLTYLLRDRFPHALPTPCVCTHRLFQPHRKTIQLPPPVAPLPQVCNRHGRRQSNHRSVWRATFGLLHPSPPPPPPPPQLVCWVNPEP
ncbi:hypothetical protein LY76DRAFT_217008 [Colletotrichum caudatum]|nr:hypothetical protein LY76DRAFT_217008 [Colletotrichum caudatum]